MQFSIFAQVKKAKKEIRVGFCMRLCVSVCNSLGVSHVNQPPAAQLPFTLLFICCCWGLGRLIRVHHSLSPSPFLSIFLSLVLAHCKQTDTQTVRCLFQRHQSYSSSAGFLRIRRTSCRLKQNLFVVNICFFMFTLLMSNLPCHMFNLCTVSVYWINALVFILHMLTEWSQWCI